MARHIVKRDGATSSESKEPEHQEIKPSVVLGGASGEPDPNLASTRIHGLLDVAPAKEEPHLSKPAKRYQVVSGPDSVMYDGCRTPMRVGKVYTENTVDLDLLRKQGVEFRELDEPEVEMSQASA